MFRPKQFVRYSALFQLTYLKCCIFIWSFGSDKIYTPDKNKSFCNCVSAMLRYPFVCVAAVSALLVDLLSTSNGYESVVGGRKIGALTENQNEQRNGWKPLDTPHLI